MASSISVRNNSVTSNGQQDYSFVLSILTSLFFIWGFVTCLNDILIPYLKSVFDLDYTQVMLIQFSFFTAYAIVSFPSGILLKKIGYKKAIIIGLITAGVGCLSFYLASGYQSYIMFLFALFILASGVTLLEVAANPYVVILGKPETSSKRLNLAQAFNSLGTTIAPIFGSILILSIAVKTSEELSQITSSNIIEYKLIDASAVQLPYLGLAFVLFIIAMIFTFVKLPVADASKMNSPSTFNSILGEKSAWRYRHLVLGALAIFVYVGAEISIGSFLAIYLGQPYIAGLPVSEAGKYVSLYWGGAMVGRFFGSITMAGITNKSKTKIYIALVFILAFVLALYVTREYKNIGEFTIWSIKKSLVFMLFVLINFIAFKLAMPKPARTLAVLAILAATFVVISMMTFGSIAKWTIVAVGLFNSIMFPTIFVLAIDGLDKQTSKGSSILCTANVGGALIPLLQGYFADTIGIHHAFFVPVLCYIYIAFYGLKGHKK